MGGALTTIGFDADDTLWHNERYFALSHDRFAALLAEHSERDHLMTRLLEAERCNLPHYGYGIKGFTLSMIETAIEVTEGKVPAEVIAICSPPDVTCWTIPSNCCPMSRTCWKTYAATTGSSW